MITIKENQLVIGIAHSEPEELREALIRDIAAAMRWRASCPDAYSKDGESQYRLAVLLENLSKYEP